ncbi:hypothetical protein PR202_gb17494 [Eleusine coracana subsp. coracana]|uniref:SKI-interacting protein SKIP SNW domain-containing protein n=1 Tax=Eleusine coracana subsp. coracana TaxID=191504 RepID=A0AAV5F2I5_ELECO|nr:hypothetical protein PR202_gb17494 [Eleusine coracana subsp. coracana]
MPYGRRAGLVPRRPEDFGDGGAFPEVHVAQYPLSMGLHAAAPGSNILPVTVDAHGRVAFDAVVRHGENSGKIVYTSHADLVPKIADPHYNANDAKDEEIIEEVSARTRAALQALIDARVSAVNPASVPRHGTGRTSFVKYRPARQSAAFNSGAAERVVRVSHAQEDPVMPPKHRHKRFPCPAGSSSSPPVTVLHSPPRPASRKDAEEWRVPPCVSDWKNPKGYSVPLHKRVAASDGAGRVMRDVQISDGFASLTEALYVAEQKAREAVETRRMVATELNRKKAERREQELREIAKKARTEMAVAAAAPVDVEELQEKAQRDMVREDRRREREREERGEAASSSKKSASARDKDRDVSERVALGMASGTGVSGGGGEVPYDERLFNQDRGMDSGFAADDQYSVYSGRLFAAQPTLSTLYRTSNCWDSDTYGGDADEQLEKIAETSRFKPE